MKRSCHEQRVNHNHIERLRNQRENESFNALSITLNLSQKCSKKDLLDKAIAEIIALRQKLNHHEDEQLLDPFLEPLDRYLQSLHANGLTWD
jgi:hypothetical protein